MQERSAEKATKLLTGKDGKRREVWSLKKTHSETALRLLPNVHSGCVKVVKIQLLLSEQFSLILSHGQSWAVGY